MATINSEIDVKIFYEFREVVFSKSENKGKISDALRTYNKIIDYDRTNIQALKEMGFLLEKTNERLAYYTFKTYLDLNPYDTEILNRIIMLNGSINN